MIDINICTKDRPTEVFGLLVSLQYQTVQEYDVYILDDGSGTPIMNFYFIQYIIQRLRLDGHNVHVIRNDRPTGVSRARQKLAEYTLEHGTGEYICRLDDDVVVAPDYLEKLLTVIGEGYDLASGVTPPLATPLMSREVRFVSPIINRVVLDESGKFLVNMDDCGHHYLEEVILPTHHFRSCALYKKEIHQKVKYDDCMTPHGFREEQFFSFRAILAGYKLGVHTGAIAWHLAAPSGGERSPQQNEYIILNQRLLNKRTRQWFEEHGDFLTAYNERLGIFETRKEQLKNVNKNNNLVMTTEE